MKRSASQLALEEFLEKASIIFPDESQNDDVFIIGRDVIRSPKKTKDFHDSADACSFFADNDFNFIFKNNRDIMDAIVSCGGGLAEGTLWAQNLTPKLSTISAATIDSHSSIVSRRTSGSNLMMGREEEIRGNSNNNNNNNSITGSSEDQSDEDDIQADTSSQQNPLALKKIRRMLSNRDSARRSRRRKQAYMVELENQVKQLKVEHETLFNQLLDVSQQYRDANTNNRVLKSDVDAMRAKVKLAEDTLARGPMTCSLNQLLQSHLSTPQSLTALRRMSNITPPLGFLGDDASYSGVTMSGQNPAATGLTNSDMTVSCVSEIWPKN